MHQRPALVESAVPGDGDILHGRRQGQGADVVQAGVACQVQPARDRLQLLHSDQPDQARTAVHLEIRASRDRFHPGQGIELLNFLAQIVAHQLDRYLDDLSV